MSRQNWQLIFLVGAVFNLLVAGAFVLFPTATLQVLGFAAIEGGVPANPVWYGLFWWLVTVFGIGYYMVSRDPVGNRGIAFMGFVGKVGVWVIATVLWVRGDVPILFELIAVGDLLFSLLFLWFLRQDSSARAGASFAH